MIFRPQDLNESRKDRTQEEEEKILDILDILGVKLMTKEIEKTKREGIYCTGRMGRPPKVTSKMEVNTVS